MNNAKEIATECERHAHAMSGIVASLKQTILDLPDNPRIKRMGPHCFIMSSKHLGDNWSVEHHDFKRQYELIVQELEKSSTEDIIKKLKTIVSEGKVRIPSTFSHTTVKLHPDVVDCVCDLCGFDWVSHAQWPQGTCPAIGDESQDTHSSKHAAQAVCDQLRAEGFGGDRKAFPLKTWVEIV